MARYEATGCSSEIYNNVPTSTEQHPSPTPFNRPLDEHGSIERSHRIDAEEFYRLLEHTVIDDANVFNDKLREWEDYYNYHRPHGALGGQTHPTNAYDQSQGVTRLRQLHTAPPAVS
jgi:hypothetical protein